MKPIARLFLTLALALTLGLGAIASAQARHQAAGQHSIVICTGYGLVTITLDADGNPVKRILPCPDCVPLQTGLPLDVVALPTCPAVFRAMVSLSQTDLLSAQPAGHWHFARAPPDLV
jgi:hypothetical protein